MFGDLGLPGADVQARVIGRGAALTDAIANVCCAWSGGYAHLSSRMPSPRVSNNRTPPPSGYGATWTPSHGRASDREIGVSIHTGSYAPSNSPSVYGRGWNISMGAAGR